MKIRKGFVSNSSSSSFILLGVKTDGNDYKTMCEKYLAEDLLEKEINEQKESKYYNEKYGVEYSDIWWENKDNISGDLDVITDDGPTYFGKKLADSEYELCDGSVSLKDFEDMKEKLKEKFPDKEVRLYFGTRAC